MLNPRGMRVLQASLLVGKNAGKCRVLEDWDPEF